MKKKLWIIVSWALIFWASPAAAEFPLHLGGFTLGDDISRYMDLVQMGTCREMSRTPYLVEGETMPRQGIKSGVISYGTCDKPNQIVRIKLKLKDSSKKFFNTLMDTYTDTFGPPGEYRGDPFQTMVAWKWSFTNADNDRISLILQHNKMVEDQKKGTAIKMTLTSQIEREKACYMKTRPKRDKPLPPKGKNLTKKQKLHLFVPR